MYSEMMDRMGQGEELSVLVASSIKKISISHLHFSKYHV